MKYTDKLKKAFTLVELTISILIVAILAVLCMPIVNNQMKKSDEYAYYVAYKTVEKIAAQILIYGDGSNDEVASSDNKIFKSIFPAANAMFYENGNIEYRKLLYKTNTTPTIIAHFPEYEWKYAAVCAGNSSIYDKDFVYYDINLGLPRLCNSLYLAGGNLTNFTLQRFSSNTLENSTLKSYLTDYSDSYSDKAMKLACEKLGSGSGAYDSYYMQDNPNECIVVAKDYIADATTDFVSTETAEPNNTECMQVNGYIAIDGATILDNDSGCGCSGDWAINNPKYCCPPAGINQQAYYTETKCIYCTVGAFNEVTGACCPNNSTYSPGRKACVCNDGYSGVYLDDTDNPASCTLSAGNCPPGTHLRENRCILNPPYLLASRFCEAINNLWNTNSSNCDTFTSVDDVNVYTSVYDAATNDNKYLNVNANPEAFKNLEPNLVFSNGLKMWILGDKAASIPGLSYNPDAYATSSDSICQFRSGVGESSCSENNYCKDEGRCYSVSTAESGPKINDARNCCANVDFSDIIAGAPGGSKTYRKDPRFHAISGFTIFVDIDGNKGSGTLWDDVFPFYISTDGHVYPGYPLNAPANSEMKYIGGNGSFLNTDVYYYDTNEDNNHRIKKYAYRSIPMARALCLSKSISIYTPYCRNLGTKFREVQGDGGDITSFENFVYGDDNPCNAHKCFLHVKNKVKFF